MMLVHRVAPWCSLTQTHTQTQNVYVLVNFASFNLVPLNPIITTNLLTFRSVVSIVSPFNNLSPAESSLMPQRFNSASPAERPVARTPTFVFLSLSCLHLFTFLPLNVFQIHTYVSFEIFFLYHLPFSGRRSLQLLLNFYFSLQSALSPRFAQ
jgi:hypothetical protein